MTHAVLASRLVPAKWLGREVLVLEGGHRVAGAAIAVSLSVVVTVAVVTGVGAIICVAPAIATILRLWSTTVAPIAIPIPEVTKIPSPPRIPIAAVVLIATSAASGTTCGRQTKQKHNLELRLKTNAEKHHTDPSSLSHNEDLMYELTCVTRNYLLCLPPSAGAWG